MGCRSPLRRPVGVSIGGDGTVMEAGVRFVRPGSKHLRPALAGVGHLEARAQRRLNGLATYRLVRYVDDFVVLVAGAREHAEALRAEVAAVLARRPCACRRRRGGSPPSTRASSSWAFASAANQARHGKALRVHPSVEDGACRSARLFQALHPMDRESQRRTKFVSRPGPRVSLLSVGYDARL